MMHEEQQYLNLIREIMEKGSVEESRNGTVRSIFGYSMRFSLKDGTVPLLTTKKVAWKTCFKELSWFIRGSTNNQELVEQNVHIWDSNASREFLDSQGLFDLKDGDLGPIYGHQWRFFNAPYTNCHTDYTDQGVDQLGSIIDALMDPNQRSSRRLVMSAWNPCQIGEVALPPCHILAQFNVRDGKYLSCALYQRSGDVGLGIPFNIASYSFLTHLLAKHCGLIAHEFVYHLGNAHIYDDHVDVLKKQLNLRPFSFPRLEITSLRDNIDMYSLNDFKLLDYRCHPSLKMKMRK